MNDRIRSAFGHIRAEEGLKRRTEGFLIREISRRSQKRRAVPRRLIPAMASLLLILAGVGGGCWFYFTPTYAICIDTDAPVELRVNCFDKVIAVESSGGNLEAASGVRFKDCAEAVSQILSDETLTAYLEEEGLSIVVTGTDEEQSSRVLAKVSACTGTQQNVYCCAGSDEELAAAEEAGLPYGKYMAFLELQALDPSVTAEEVSSMSLKEIRNWIAALSGEESDTSQPQGQGQGYQNGQGSQDGQGYQNGQGGGNGKGPGKTS